MEVQGGGGGTFDDQVRREDLLQANLVLENAKWEEIVQTHPGEVRKIGRGLEEKRENGGPEVVVGGRCKEEKEIPFKTDLEWNGEWGKTSQNRKNFGEGASPRIDLRWYGLQGLHLLLLRLLGRGVWRKRSRNIL